MELCSILLWHSGWEVSFRENGYRYMYGWVPLLFSWNYHNIVNWLYPNKKKIKSFLNDKKEKIIAFTIALKRIKYLRKLTEVLSMTQLCDSVISLWHCPGSSDGKESFPQCRKHVFNPWVGKIPWRRAWQPTPVFLPGESPWAEEPGGLQSTRSQRVRHDWVTKHSSRSARPVH